MISIFFYIIAGTSSQPKSRSANTRSLISSLISDPRCRMHIFESTKLFSTLRSSLLLCPRRSTSLKAFGSLHDIKLVSTMAGSNLPHYEPHSQTLRTTLPTQLHTYPSRGQKRANHTSSLIENSRHGKKTTTRAYIALGSNVGDRLHMIEKACEMLRNDPDITFHRTSCLYETEPMYVENQSRFLNGACEVCRTPSRSKQVPKLTFVD